MLDLHLCLICDATFSLKTTGRRMVNCSKTVISGGPCSYFHDRLTPVLNARGSKDHGRPILIFSHIPGRYGVSKVTEEKLKLMKNSVFI